MLSKNILFAFTNVLCLASAGLAPVSQDIWSAPVKRVDTAAMLDYFHAQGIKPDITGLDENNATQYVYNFSQEQWDAAAIAVGPAGNETTLNARDSLRLDRRVDVVYTAVCVGQESKSWVRTTVLGGLLGTTCGGVKFGTIAAGTTLVKKVFDYPPDGKKYTIWITLAWTGSTDFAVGSCAETLNRLIDTYCEESRDGQEESAGGQIKASDPNTCDSDGVCDNTLMADVQITPDSTPPGATPSTA